jgi:hypothetical protein
MARKLRKEIILLSFPNLNTASLSEIPVYPECLFDFISYLMFGQTTLESSNPAAVLNSVCEIITYNTKKYTPHSEVSPQFPRQTNTRESELLVYVATKIWSETRNKSLIEKLFSHGLCISFKRLQEIKKKLANDACMQYHENNVVCPLQLPSGLITTAAIDNIDHNTTSTTANESFHGTAVSLKVHPTSEKLEYLVDKLISMIKKCLH